MLPPGSGIRLPAGLVWRGHWLGAGHGV